MDKKNETVEKKSYSKDEKKSYQKKSYSKDDENKSYRKKTYSKDGEKKNHRKKSYSKDGEKKTYEKKPYSKDGKYSNDKRDDRKKMFTKGKDTEEKAERREIEGFDPLLSKLSKKNKIICFVCKEEAMVSFLPVEGVPALCDKCHMDMEAKRLLYEEKRFLKTIVKLDCQICHKSFYAPNDSFLFCEECYNSFSRKIHFAKKGLVEFVCEECGEVGYLFEKILKIRERFGEKKLCKKCFAKNNNKTEKKNAPKRKRLSIRKKSTEEK